MKKDPFDFERTTLENIEIFYRRTTKGVTRVGLLLKAGGTRYDPIGKEGCSHLLEHLSWKGNFPNYRTKREYELEHLIKWTAITGFEDMRAKGECKTDSLKRLLTIFNGCLTRPKLTEQLLQNEKQIVYGELNPEQRNKKWIRHFLRRNQLIFGKQHPLSRFLRPAGSSLSIPSLKIEDLIRHKEKFFVASNLTVIVMTSLSLDKITALLKECLQLPEGEPPILPKALEVFSSPRKKFLQQSISELLGIPKLEKVEGTRDIVVFHATIPALCLPYDSSTIAMTLKEILLETLRVTESLIYGVDLSLYRFRDLAKVEIKANFPVGKGEKAIKLISKGIAQFRKERRLFNLLKRKCLFDIENYQAAFRARIMDSTIDDIALYDHPVTIREQIESVKNFDFPKAVKWVQEWLSPERTLIEFLVP